MKRFRKAISLVLLFSIILSSSAFAYTGGVNESNVIETDTERIATTYDEDYKVETTYNKVDNTMRLVTFQENEVIEDLFIDLNAEVEKQEEEFSIEPYEDTGKRKLDSQYTILNYEYEEWHYPNHNNGQGTFWNLRTFSNGFRLCYEPYGGNQYTRPITRFIDAVDNINIIEGRIGATAVVAVGVAIRAGFGGLQAKIEGILLGFGIAGAVTTAYELYTSIRTCQTSWNTIYN